MTGLIWETWLSFTFLLHQTTTAVSFINTGGGCLLPFFYIKPQLVIRANVSSVVVFYLSSTSNHNLKLHKQYLEWVVFYLSSTSNHNLILKEYLINMLSFTFLLHQTTTSSSTISETFGLSFTFLLHQTTTLHEPCLWILLLSFTFLLHQTTTIISFTK